MLVCPLFVMPEFDMLKMCAAASAGLLFVAPAAAQTSRYEVTVSPQTAPGGYEKVHVSKAALGSAPIRVWFNTSIEPDCSPHGQTTLTVLHPPEHGTMNISDEPFFVAYSPASARAACSKQKVPGHQAFYTANAGYTGHDKAVLQGSQSDGYVRRITVDIDVR